MKRLFAILLLSSLLGCAGVEPASAAVETAVFAGGCFWGVEAVFENVRGVSDARSGYAGGDRETANYEAVSSGNTKHAESVEVRFDPSKVSYEKLLEIFFSVIHDPTQLDRQGPDEGPQYRSAVFYRTEGQKTAAEAVIRKLAAAKTFPNPIVTEVSALKEFFPAEDYHQDYMQKNPNDPYIVYHDVPKVAALRKRFPEFVKK
jgi:peptide-methionine (S)-S-oxide reductase